MELDLLSAELITIFVPITIAIPLITFNVFKTIKSLKKAISITVLIALITGFINSATTKLYNFIMQSIILFLLIVIIILMYHLLEEKEKIEKGENQNAKILKP